MVLYNILVLILLVRSSQFLSLFYLAISWQIEISVWSSQIHPVYKPLLDKTVAVVIYLFF